MMLINLCHVIKTNSLVQLLNDPFEIEDPYYGDEKGFEIVYDKNLPRMQKSSK